MPPTPGAMLRFALRGFFRQKKLTENIIMCIYEKKLNLLVFPRKLMIQTPGAMLRFALRGFFFGNKKLSENLIMRTYEKKVDL